MIDQTATRPITCLLSDRYVDWETGFISGPGRAFHDLDIRFASPKGEDVTSMDHLRVSGLAPFVRGGDKVVVACGGMAWKSPDAALAELRGMLRTEHAA
jgi:hypothetical protein